MAFNVKDYEPVKARKLRFYTTFPDGRITVELINPGSILEAALIRASVFCNSDDQARQCARGVGYAFEVRDMEKQKNQYGKEYESVNYSSWTENAEESAVGRALDNAGFASNMHCSAEEMAKAERMKDALTAKKAHDTIVASTQATTNEGKVRQYNAAAAQQSFAATNATTSAPSVPTVKSTTTSKAGLSGKSSAANPAFRNSPLPEGVDEPYKKAAISRIQELVSTKKIPIPRVTEIIELNWAPAKMLKDLDAKQLKKLHETLAVM